MERFDVHSEVCEIVIESATIVAILESASKMLRRPRNSLRRVIIDARINHLATLSNVPDLCFDIRITPGVKAQE
jgi:hypothetical protein